MPEIEQVAAENAKRSGGSYKKVHTMEEAFENADIVYPKSWASYAIMEERTKIVETGDKEALKALEKRCLEGNANFKNWECTEEMMARTHEGKALYMHCLPADITGVSCKEGEVAASVFDRYRDPLYKQASFKPYIIAAMIFLSKFRNPADKLQQLLDENKPRIK